MKKALILAVGTMLGAMAAGAQTPTTDVGFLLKAYTRFVLAQEVQAQAQELARPRPEAEAQAIAAEAKRWMAAETDQMRAELADRFGQAARDRFSAFVAEYTAAEKDNDLHYLGRLAGDALLGDTPFEFPAMRRLVLEKWLTQPFADGSRFLGEIQTWSDLRALDYYEGGGPNNQQGDLYFGWDGGRLGSALSDGLFGVFGLASFLVPPALVLVALVLMFDPDLPSARPVRAGAVVLFGGALLVMFATRSQS